MAGSSGVDAVPGSGTCCAGGGVDQSFRCAVGWPVERFCGVRFLRSKRRTQKTEQTGGLGSHS